MANIIEVKTFKHSDVYGTEKPWFNTWVFSVPFALSDYTFNRFVTNLVRLESGFHHQHVKFDHVSGILINQKGRPGESNARFNSPFNGNIRGYWGNPPTVAPFHWCKRVQKYTRWGYMGLMWFRGGLATVDGVPDERGRLRMVYQDFWNSTIQGWLTGIRNDYGATMLVPQGINRYGSAIGYAEVVSMRVAGITLANDNKRAAARLVGNGKAIFESLIETALLFEQFRNQMYDYLEFYNDLAPGHEIKNKFLNLVGDVKAIANRAKGYAEGVDNGDGTKTAPAFRWAPSPDDVISLCESITEPVQKDIQQVQQKTLNPPDGSAQYMTHTDTDDVMNRLSKYSAGLAQLVAVDWRNPANTA